MPSDNVLGTVTDMFDDLKSRLGFVRDEDRYEPDEPGDYAYDYDYGEYEDYGDDAAVGGYVPARTYQSRSSRYGRAESSPNLVSFNDVKASTAVPDRLMRDPIALKGDDLGATRVGGQYVFDATAPVPASPAYKAAQRDGVLPAASEAAQVQSGTAVSATAASASSAGGAPSSYDPYEAYSGARTAAHVPTRGLTVVKPVAYGDAEQVARAVKAGDVVVLSLRATGADLSKRILDFSFGVASALEASVECPADKVFAIARGNALSDDEKSRLRAQGIL